MTPRHADHHDNGRSLRHNRRHLYFFCYSDLFSLSFIRLLYSPYMAGMCADMFLIRVYTLHVKLNMDMSELIRNELDKQVIN